MVKRASGLQHTVRVMKHLKIEPSDSESTINPKCKKKKFIIEDVITKCNEKSEPCLVKFSNGILKKNTNVTGQLYRNGTQEFIRRQKERILKIKGPNLTYTGKNFGVEKINPFKEQLFIGVYDKSTKEMHLYEANSFLVNYEPATPDSFLSFKMEEDESFANREKALQESFGGKRGRSIARKIQEKRVDISAMSGVLEEALQEITPMKENSETKDEDSYRHILPRSNRQALNVFDVYRLDDIITENELLLFNEFAVNCLEDSSSKTSYSPLFNYSLANAKFLSTEPDQAKAVCVALYMEQLLIILSTKFRQTPKLNQCPKEISIKIQKAFLDGKLRKPTKTEEDKIVAYVIVLSLIINKFEVPLSALCRSIKIKRDKLEVIIRIVGAYVMKDTGNVLLKTPLNAYVPKFGRKKNK